MSAPGLSPALPAESFISLAEFQAHLDRARERLDMQARAEARLLTGEATLVQDATCAPCLRRTVLATRADPGRPPDWAHQLVCDCPDRFDAATRALLHAAMAAGLRGWSRLLLFGPPLPIHRRLRALAGETVALPDLGAGNRLAAPDGAFQVIVAADCLHRVPAFLSALAELRRVAAPGCTLLATLPFRHRVAVSASTGKRLRAPGLAPVELHAIGWDVLAMLRRAGWAHAEMLRVWNRELGYLGPHTFILRAAA